MEHENPIEEVWRARNQISAECGHDVDRLFDRLRAREKEHADRVVEPSPPGATTETQAVLREEPPTYRPETGSQGTTGAKRDNPIEEVWRIRDQLSAEEGHDVHRLFERLRREEQNYADRLVQPPPRRAKPDGTGHSSLE
jgi:hypothetical protein